MKHRPVVSRFVRPLAPVLATLAVAVTACGAPDGVTSPTVPTEADTRAPFWHGVFLGDAASTPEGLAGALEAYRGLSGRKPALVKTFHRIDAALAPEGWAGRVVHQVAATGATNLIALDPDWGGRRPGPLLDAVLRGDADAHFDRTARALAQLGGLVLVELAWEMNGDWQYGWQGVANGADSAAPAKFARAWRHVVDRFRAAGATNVRWVFNPNVGNAVTNGATGSAHWNWYGHYYPGDAYVDYVGAHGYNAPAAFGMPFRWFDDLFYGGAADNVLDDMKRRFPGKPIIIGEIAAEETTGGEKPAWVERAYARMLADPQIVGAVWFHMRKEADWRLDSSPGSARAYRDALQHPAVRDRFDESALARTFATR